MIVSYYAREHWLFESLNISSNFLLKLAVEVAS